MSKNDKRKKKLAAKKKAALTKKHSENEALNKKNSLKVFQDNQLVESDSMQGFSDIDLWFGFEQEELTFEMHPITAEQGAVCAVSQVSKEFAEHLNKEEFKEGDWMVNQQMGAGSDLAGPFSSKTEAMEYGRKTHGAKVFRNSKTLGITKGEPDYQQLISEYNGDVDAWVKTIQMCWQEYGFGFNESTLFDHLELDLVEKVAGELILKEGRTEEWSISKAKDAGENAISEMMQVVERFIGSPESLCPEQPAKGNICH